MAGVAATLVVFAVHFRPWQGGLVEDIGLASVWDTEGFGGFVSRIPFAAGRPLHMLPHFTGMALSDGGYVGMYAILAGVAVGQLWGAWWALAPLVRSSTLRLVLGVVVALHPWWAAGDILRFLSAQVAVMSFVVWLGAAVRYLNGRSSWWLAAVVLVPAAGLLTYQSTAGPLALGAAVLAVALGGSRRRGIWLVLLTWGTVLAVLVWSSLIAPRLSDEASYESGLLTNGGGLDVVESTRVLLRTVAVDAPGVIITLAAVGLLVIGLGVHARITPVRTWVLLATLAAAPFTGLVFAAAQGLVSDHERIAQPIGMTAWFVAAVALSGVDLPRRTVWAFTAVALIPTLAASALAYGHWTRLADERQSMVDAVVPIRDATDPGQRLVVADWSGRYGGLYLLLESYLDITIAEQEGPGAQVVLCTPDQVPRVQSYAASCTGLIPDGAEHVGTVSTDLGDADVFRVPAP